MPTVALPGAPLHVVQQAAAFQPMFREPRSFRVFLLDLGEAAAIHGCAVHAYVLTSDRVHLLVTPN
jgi:putative transposase